MNLLSKIFDFNNTPHLLLFVKQGLLLIVTFLVLGVGLGFVEAYKLKNKYRSSTEILLKTENQEMGVANIMAASSRYYGYDTYSNIVNQKRVLQSFDLLKEVVERMNWQYRILHVGRLRERELYKNSPFEIDSFVIKNPNVVNKIELDYQSNSVILRYEKNGDDVELELPKSQNKIENSDLILHIDNKDFPTGSRYQVQKLSQSGLVYNIKNAFSISEYEYSSVLNLQYTDVVAQRTTDLLDTVLVVFEEFSVKNKVKNNERTLQYINTQLEEADRMISEDESQLEVYRKEYSIVDLDAVERNNLEKISALNQQKLELERKVKASESLRFYLKDNESGFEMPPFFFIPSEDPFVVEVLNKLNEINTEVENPYSGVKSNSPVQQETQGKRERLKKELILYLEKAKVAFKDDINRVNGLLKELELNVINIPLGLREVYKLQRNIEANEKLYSYLVEKKAEVMLQKATISSGSEVVEVPRYIGTVGQSKSSVQGKYVLYGFLIGFVLALVRFVFFFKLKNIRDVKTWSDLPILGSMQYLKKDFDIRSPDFLKTDLADSLRSIRASLKFIDANQKTILVTSMFPSEGKSLNSICQAAIQASAGKRTILIDFDLHKPSLHKKLDLKNNKGMTDFLSGQTDDIDSLTTEIRENFYVMSSGVRPPNPSELVLSERTTELIKRLQSEFDQVVIDTPPLHLITDAKILQAFADINVLVLNVKNSTRKTLMDIEEYKERFSPKNMVVLLNGVKESKLSYLYSYKYKYAYKYGYGYAGYKYSYNYGKK